MKQDRRLIIRLKCSLMKLAYLDPLGSWVSDLEIEAPSTPDCNDTVKEYWLRVAEEASLSILEKGNLTEDVILRLSNIQKDIDQWVNGTQKSYLN
jgi:hypothetical protein